MGSLIAQELRLVLSSWMWLAFFIGVFVGLVSWIAYIFWTQRKIVKTMTKMVTRDEFHEAFKKFRREIKGQ